MHVGVNGLFLQRIATGTGQYTRQLLRLLPALHPGATFTVVGGRVWPPDSHSRWRSAGFGPSMDGRYHDVAKLWWEQFGFPAQARRSGATLLHSPYWASPLVPGLPSVVTIHDVIHALLPDYRGNAKVRAYTRLVSASARRASAIVVDSECSRRDAVRVVGVDPTRVHVVYLAADERYRPMPDHVAATSVERRWGIAQPYFLYIGATDRRKDVPTLLRAWRRIVGTLPDHVLVIGGFTPPHRGSLYPDLGALMRDLGIEAHVRLIGPVGDDEKHALLAGCRAFVFPSIYEGFGLPPLEGMATGAAVVAARASSIPEVVCDAGLMFAPGDDAELAEHLGTLATEPGARAHVREACLAQAQRFSWRRTAEQTLAVYEEVKG